MVLNIIFGVSGVAVASIVLAKMWEGKGDRQREGARKPFLLRLISLGDERLRLLSHELAHQYADKKDDLHFFVEKQLPLHTKNIINKTQTFIKEEAEKRFGDIRGSKFLRKDEGISEFFKSISEKENEGRIDDTMEEGSQEGEIKVD